MDKLVHAHGRFELKRLATLVPLVALAAPLVAQSQSQANDQAGVVLPQIQISAHKMGDTTEGTGSYTTGRSKTALPLSMSLRDTPQSVTVVTQQRIEDQGLTTVTDVVNNVTGVSVNQYESNRAGFTSRGFDIDNLQIDGIPTTWDQAWSSGEVTGSLAVYDRIEVVRGATGLMTGAGNPSAAINLVRKHATSKELTGSAEVGIGNWQERRAMADVSTPLTKDGSVRARVVGEYSRRDSWIDLAKNNSKTVYATVDADLTPKTLLSVGYTRQETDPKGPMWGGLPYWYSDGSLTNWDVSKTSAAGWSSWKTEYDNYFATVEHEFDSGWKVRASAARSDRKADSFLLYQYGVPDRATGAGMGGSPGSYLTHTTQNDFGLHASGPFQLFGRKHEAAIGYQYSEQKFASDSRAADFGNQSSSIGNFNNWNGAAYPTPAWSAPTFYENSITRQQALYGVARLSITDPLKLIVGARVSNYEKTGHGLYTPQYQLKNDHEVTPYAGAVYDLNDTWSAYASYTQIFQPQNAKDFGGATLAPITGKNVETGVKGEFFEGRLNVSAAIFKIKQDNLAQAGGLVDRDGSGPLAPEAYYVGSTGATSKGIEFEVSGELAKGWNATAGYTNFKAQDANGDEFNSIYPRKLLRVYTTYRLPGELSNMTVGGGINWEGRTNTLDPNAPAANSSGGMIEQEAYSLVNLMARYEFSKQLSAQLNVNNVFDKKHFGMFAAYGAITYAAPRQATLTLKYRF